MREAELERCDASISFASLVREIPEFPTHVIVDSQHLVENWGDGAASWWYYAHRGVTQEFISGSPVSFAELLESMMPKFLESAQELGFQSCKREPGTWKVVASWKPPDGRTHAAETQFSMLSSAEKELLRNLATMAPNGDELKKSFAKVL
eukprot:g7016.t1